MPSYLEQCVFWAGIGQISVLIASAVVAFQLNFRTEFERLPLLHRQLCWVYAGYTVLAILSLGLITLTNAVELASGGPLARCFCGYAFVFWGVRLLLQGVLAAKEHLTRWWLRLGYYLLTVLFLYFTTVFGWAALGN